MRNRFKGNSNGRTEGGPIGQVPRFQLWFFDHIRVIYPAVFVVIAGVAALDRDWFWAIWMGGLAVLVVVLDALQWLIGRHTKKRASTRQAPD